MCVCVCVCRESDQRGSRGYAWRRRRRLVSLRPLWKNTRKIDSIRVSFFQLQYLSDGLLDRNRDFQYTNALTGLYNLFFFFFFVADFRKSDRIFASSQTEGFNRWIYERILLMERNPIIFEVEINQLSFDFVSKFCWLDHAGKGVRNRISISPPAIQLSSRDFLSKRGLINY